MSFCQTLWGKVRHPFAGGINVRNGAPALELRQEGHSNTNQPAIMLRTETKQNNSSETLGTLWNSYKQSFYYIYANERWYIYVLIAVAILGYGFTITNFSISLDDLSTVSCDNSITLDGLGQKRLGGAISNILFCGPAQALPIFQNFLAVLALVSTAIAWSLLFRRVSGEKLSTGTLLAFATLFITYPLIHEVFIYCINFAVCFDYLLIALSLMLSTECVLYGKKSRWHIILAVLFLSTAISSYESFAAVYLSGFLMVLILHYGFDNTRVHSVTLYVRYGLKYCWILIASLIVFSILGTLILWALGMDIWKATGAHRDVYWFWPGCTGLDKIKNCFITIFFDYGYNALFYSPICTYMASLFIALGIMVVWCWRKRSFIPFWLVGGLVASTFSLSILQGQAVRYRTCQSLALFIAFVFMLLFHRLRNHKARFILAGVICFMVLDQTKDLNLWFWNDYRRCEMDRTNFISLAQRIQAKYGLNISKPIVILGRTKEYTNLRGVGGTGRDGLARLPIVGRAISQLPRRKTVSQNNGVSLFTHGTEGGAWEFYRHLEYYGYRFKEPTPEQVNNVKSMTMGMNLPAWPQEGCLLELDDAIVVHLGDETWEDENLSPHGEDVIAKNLRNIERRKSILRRLFRKTQANIENGHADYQDK